MANVSPISASQMSLVLDVSRTLAVVLDLDELLPRMAQATCQLLQCRRASVWLHDPDKSTLATRVALQTEPITQPDSSGIVGAAFTQNAVLNVARPYEDPRFNPDADRRDHFLTENLLAAPMVDLSAKPIGVIQAINKIDGTFTAGDEALLRLLADQAAVAIQRQRLHVAAAAAQSLRREMALARSVQQALIPSFAPHVPGLRVAGWTKAASMTGGDCYDFWTLPDGRLAVLVADASGHGIGPALIVSQVRTMTRLLCESEGGSPALVPADVLSRINRRLEIDLAPGRFVTAVLAFIDGDGTVTFASAGHGPSLLKPGPQQSIQSLDSGGLPLGLFPDCFDSADSPTTTLRLEPGGYILLMSDGIFEAFDPNEQQFGIERVRDLFDRSHESPAALIESMKSAIDAWHCRTDPEDDQTLVAVQRDQ